MEAIRVLLIEDEKKIADTLAKGLRELDYEVAIAYDGKIGLRIFESGSFDLIILAIPSVTAISMCPS